MRSSQSRFLILAALAAAVLFAGSVFGPAALNLAAAEPPPPPQESPAAAKTLSPEEKAALLEKDVTQGALRVVQPDGKLVECPLKHTDVEASISGFIARAKVTQTFHNPLDEKIEAVYVFPLPHEAAIDDMTMVIGDRRIVGLIKRRDEARAIYEQALLAGHTAALLEQERPNIFTQSVGNIEPGQEVKIEISYADVLNYDMGTYEFHFPMVVGPRYIPGQPTGGTPPQPAELAGKVSPPVRNTDRVPDATRISPPVLKPGYRTGHDISLSVQLDAGVPIQGLAVPNHQSQIERDGDRQARIKLSPADSIPNKDFVLRYQVVGEKPEMALLAHTGEYSGDARALGKGYFMLMIQPQEDERLTKSPPREIVFLVDVSGSMSGQPTAKVIEAMQQMLKLCRPQDTLQVVTFASQADKLFDKPVPVTGENVARALRFSEGLRGSGGTEMLKGVKLAIDEPLDAKRLRIIVMLTDGYIGNEAEIIEHVGKHCGDQIRFWCLGIGSAPNMFLVDGVARQGGGMGKRLGLEDDSASLAQEVMTRIQRAQLAKIRIDWGGLQVAETYPAKIPELWAGRPVILLGRYAGGGEAEITVRGEVEGEPASWPLKVSLPAEEPRHEVLAKVWARRKVESLMHQTYYAGSPEVEEIVTGLALDYRLMSPYTSFVAVDADEAGKIEPAARPPRRMLVPVPLPAGTRWEGFFGEGGEADDGPIPGLAAFGKDVARQRVADGQPGDRYYFQAPGATPASGLAVTPPAGKSLAYRRLPSAARSAALSESLSRVAGENSRALRRENGAFSQPPGVGAFGGGFGGGGFGGKLGGIPGPTGPAGQRGVAALSVSGDGAAIGPPAESAEAAAREPGLDLTAQALASQDSSRPAAEKAFQKAQKIKDTLLAKAAEHKRELLLRAYLLDMQAVRQGHSAGEIAAQALAELEALREAQTKRWSKELPVLTQKLDLVIRDRSLAEALEQVSAAAKLDVSLVPGSLDDVQQTSGGAEPRTSYLDLRGATVSQALDWICRPAGLDWKVDGKKVTVLSERRRAGKPAWVYDVSLVALPAADELQKLGDHSQQVAAARERSEKFLTMVREHLASKQAAVDELAWVAPGQLLLCGHRSAHDAAATLFEQLADPQAKLSGLPAKYQLSRQEASRRKEAAKRQAAALQRAEVAAAHDEFGWRLLAAAAGGQVDLEALTELEIAWNNPATQKLLQGQGAPVVLRSGWMVIEASRAMPQQAELATLAEAARQRSQPAATDALAALEKSPSDAGAFTAAVYAALALADQPELLRRAREVIARKPEGEDPLSAARQIAVSLLAERASIDREALAKLAREGVAGDDLVALLALACKRAGGEAWETFRAEAPDLLGDQPLDGSVVVLVNHLAAGRLPLVAAR